MRPGALRFLIAAPAFSHRSTGVRVLHRLCHLLNEIGHPAAIWLLGSDPRPPTNPDWNTPVASAGPVGTGTVVVYPEVVRGNPLGAARVVRWLLNYPGVLGGDSSVAAGEMVLLWDALMLERVNAMLGRRLDASNVLKVAFIDPALLYPDPGVEKTVDCYFVHKGAEVRSRFRLPDESTMTCIDRSTPSLAHLGDLLRRTRNLFSYDHSTLLFHEALVSGCSIFQVHADGGIADPRTCSVSRLPCAEAVTDSWPPADFAETYHLAWNDPAPARKLAAAAEARWGAAGSRVP